MLAGMVIAEGYGDEFWMCTKSDKRGEGMEGWLERGELGVKGILGMDGRI